MTESEELESRHLHVFCVTIEGHGADEVVFQGMTRHEAKLKLLAWVKTEPFIAAREVSHG